MQPVDETTLGDYLDEWLARRRSQLRPTTLQSYRQVIDCYLRPRLGPLPLSGLDRRCIERHYAHLIDAGGQGGKPLSPRTVQYAHAVLHRALTDARLDGLLDANPASLARRPVRDPHEVEVDDGLQVWTAEEARRFLELTADHPLHTLWQLALGTGGRRGELLGLRWDDVDLDGAQVTIQRALSVVDGVARLLRTKTSRSRTLAIAPSIVAALRRHRETQRSLQGGADRRAPRWDLVITDEHGSYVEPIHVTREFRRLVRTLDVPVIRMHDLRHTHASLLLAQGVQAKVVSERLGHSSIAMTMDVYSHMLPAMDQDAVSLLDAAMYPDASDS